MSKQGVSVYIQDNPIIDTLEIYIESRVGDQRRFIEAENIVMRTITDGEVPKPAFLIRGSESREVLAALADALADRGVQTDKDAKIEGTLDATRYHLEDLRQLLKLKGGK